MGAYAQSGFGGSGWIQVGFSPVQGLRPFADSLKPYGLSAPASPSGFSAGIGGGGYAGRLFIGGHAEILAGKQLLSGAGVFRLGPFFRWKDRSLLIPAVGLGWNGYSVTVSGRPSDAPFSQAVWQSGGLPPRSFIIGGAAGEISLALHRVSLKGFLIGTEISYMRSISKSNDWRAAGVALNDGPTVLPQRFALRLILGRGGLSEKTE